VMLEEEYEQVLKEAEKKSGTRNRNDFKLLRVVGQGSYGKVYLVQCKETEQLFAMKELKKEELHKKN